MSVSAKKEKSVTTENKEKKSKNVGSVTQIIGPVLDIIFPAGKMPNIYNALLVQGKNKSGEDISVTCEVQQLLGDNCVRAISMIGTDGLMRGMDVVDTKNPLTIPVGEPTLGRIFNVLGEPVDNLGDIQTQDVIIPKADAVEHARTDLR